MVKKGEADVFLSAGSTGALLAGGLFILGRIQGIDRPTLATVYPDVYKRQISMRIRVTFVFLSFRESI